MTLGPVSCALLSFSQAYGPERQSISILLFQIRFMSFWLINRNGPILLTLTLESGADLRLRSLGRKQQKNGSRTVIDRVSEGAQLAILLRHLLEQRAPRAPCPRDRAARPLALAQHRGAAHIDQQ